MEIDAEKAGLAFTAIAGGVGAMWGVWRANRRDDNRQQAEIKKSSDDAAFDRLNHYCDRQQTQIDALVEQTNKQQAALDECAEKHEECEEGRLKDREQAEATRRQLQQQITALKGAVKEIKNGGST